MRRLLFCALFAIVLPGAATGEPPCAATGEPPGGIYHGRMRQLEVRLAKTDASIRVDGRLDDAAWSDAAVLTGFSQFAPVDRLPAEDSS